MARGVEVRLLTATALEGVSRPQAQVRKSSGQDARARNRAMVLRLLHREGPLTRPDLKARTGLSTPSVGAVVADLIEDGLVRDIGSRGERKVGKPPTVVELCADELQVLALDLSPFGVFAGAVVTAAGDVVARAEVEIGSRQAGLADVDALVSRLAALATGRVVGIGVASPGVVDAAGVVLLSDRHAWHDLDLEGHLRQTTGHPVVVGNDVNLAALGVRGFRAPSARDLVLVTIVSGVGAAVVVDGAVLPGERFASGEIGHVRASDSGEVCECGRTGCLELAIGASHLERRLARRPRAEVMADAGAAFARVVAPVVSMLDVTEVGIVGPAELVEGDLLAAVREQIAELTLPAITSDLLVTSYAGDPDLTLLGAASVVLETQLLA